MTDKDSNSSGMNPLGQTDRPGADSENIFTISSKFTNLFQVDKVFFRRAHKSRNAKTHFLFGFKRKFILKSITHMVFFKDKKQNEFT